MNSWAKTMENIVLHLKREREVPSACVVQHHVKVAHILPGYGICLNLKEISIRAHIDDAKSNLMLTEECLYRAYLSKQNDTCKINNALVYQILLKIFRETDA